MTQSKAGYSNSDPLTPEKAARGVNKLALMAFFPGDPEVRSALVEILLEMVDTNEQLDWLVKRALKLYAKWPGVGEIRALYCSKWKPKDGIETYSSIYVEGIPAERPVPFYDGDRVGPPTSDPEFSAKVTALAKRPK